MEARDLSNSNKDENVEICHCIGVTYRDIEDAMHETASFSDVVEGFKSVQEKTQCTTGCGGCYNDILDTISEIMNS